LLKSERAVGVGIGRLAILTVMGLVSPVMAGETIRVTIDKLKFDPAQIIGDTIVQFVCSLNW